MSDACLHTRYEKTCTWCGKSLGIVIERASVGAAAPDIETRIRNVLAEFDEQDAVALKVFYRVSPRFINDVCQMLNSVSLLREERDEEALVCDRTSNELVECRAEILRLRSELERLEATALTEEERVLILEMLDHAKVQSWANGTVLSDNYLNLRKRLRRASPTTPEQK